MASVLQPFHDSITAELSALRQEIRSLSSELDTSGSSTKPRRQRTALGGDCPEWCGDGIGTRCALNLV